MANETIETSSFANQKPNDDDDEEFCENVPPASVSGVTGPTTPTLTCNNNGKLPLSGLQSALTPILKYLNIGNKPPPPLPNFSSPAKPNSASLLSVGGTEKPACSMLNENLPEITLLDITCESTMNITRNPQCDSASNSPIITKEWKNSLKVLDVNLNSKLCPTRIPVQWLRDEILPEMTLLDDTCDSSLLVTRPALHSDAAPDTPVCKTNVPKNLDEKAIKSKVNITLTPKFDTSSAVSESETQVLQTFDDGLPKTRPMETSGFMSAKTSKLETSQCSVDKMSTTFTGNFTHSISSECGVSVSIEEDVKKVQLQVTQDISMSSILEKSKSSLEKSTQKMDESPPAAETHPANITRDLSASNTSAQQERQSANDVTSELPVEPVKASPEEELRCISVKTGGGNQSKALNSTFPGPAVLQNRTVDILLSENSCGSFTTKNTTANVSTTLVSPGSFLVLNTNCSDSKLSQNSAMQNLTFEKNSSRKSDGNIILAQVSPRKTGLQNTFENKPNVTVTCTETSEKSDNAPSTAETSSPSPVKDVSPTEANLPKALETMDSNAKEAEPLESTFNLNTAVGEKSASNGEVKDSSNNCHPLCESIFHHSTFTESQKANTFNLDNTFDFKSDPLVTSTPMPTNKAFNYSVEREGKTAAAQKKLYGEGSNKPGMRVASEVPANIVCDRKTFLRQPATKQNLLPIKPLSLLSKFKPGSLLSKRQDLAIPSHPVKPISAQILQQTTGITSSYNLRSTSAVASAFKQPVSGLRKPTVSAVPSGNQRAGHCRKPPQTKTTASVPSAFDKPAGGTNPVGKTTLPAKRHHLPRTEALPAAKKKKIDTPLPSSNIEASVASDTAKAKSVMPPSHSQRMFPAKPPKHDGTVPSSDAAVTCEQTSRDRTLRSLATTVNSHITKPLVTSGCAACSSLEKQLKLKDDKIKQLKKGCSSLEEQLKLKDEEIKLLKQELLKWSKTEEPAS